MIILFIIIYYVNLALVLQIYMSNNADENQKFGEKVNFSTIICSVIPRRHFY